MSKLKVPLREIATQSIISSMAAHVMRHPSILDATFAELSAELLRRIQSGIEPQAKAIAETFSVMGEQNPDDPEDRGDDLSAVAKEIRKFLNSIC